MNTIRFGFLLCCVLASLFAGCGAPPEGVSFQIEQKYLTKITKLQLWVLDNKLKNNDPLTCLDLLQYKKDFIPANFVSQTTRTLVAGLDSQRVELDNLELGDKLFLAAGYGDKDPETKPQIFGCYQATVEAGKKLAVSIGLIPYQKTP